MKSSVTAVGPGGVATLDLRKRVLENIPWEFIEGCQFNSSKQVELRVSVVGVEFPVPLEAVGRPEKSMLLRLIKEMLDQRPSQSDPESPHETDC